jgi:hypothetical protein
VNGAAFAPPGRQVRCKKCQYSWFQSPPAEEELALVDDVAEGPPVVKRPLPPPPPPPAPEPEPVVTPVRATESAIATAMRKADMQAEAVPVQPAAPEPPVQRRVQPAPPPPPPVVEEDAPAPVVQPFQPAKTQPAAAHHRAAPPPYRPQPQTFQPASEVSGERGWLAQLGALAIWAGVFVFIGLVIGSAYFYRYDIIKTWRPAATIYALFGLDVNVRGLVFTISSDQVPRVENGVVVKGEIVNVSEEEQPIPKIYGVFLDEGGKSVYDWSFTVEAQTVAPGGKVPFLTKVENPPATANKLELRFAPLNE